MAGRTPTPRATDRIWESWRLDHLLLICWRQWRTERSLRRRGIDFRTTDPDEVRKAYAAMTPEEFAAINGRQGWANSTTIFRSIRGLLPEGPLFALDLGSGLGESTACLAGLLHPDSRIIGIEFSEHLVEIARTGAYTGGDGRPRPLEFVVGSVLETFRDEDGEAIADHSVDLVNASGILGHHLDPPEAERMLDEVVRVLKQDGVAALDVGPKLSVAGLTGLMADRGFARLRRTRSNLFDRTGQVVFQRSESISASGDG